MTAGSVNLDQSTLTESTFLTSGQAAARLGVKTATLYAYVSRGLLPRHRSADGRTSLFDARDVAGLARRARPRRSPSEVTVASDISLVDAGGGGLWYRGVDALRLSRQLHFEEIAWLLWTGSFERMDSWRADPRTLTAAAAVDAPTLVDRVVLASSAIAATHRAHPPTAGTAAASDVMASLVDCLPGPSRGTRTSIRLATKLARRPLSMPLIRLVDAALALCCEQGLTHAALVARLSTSAGGDIATAVSAAMAVAAATRPTAVFRGHDPRARTLADIVAEAAPGMLHGREPKTLRDALGAVARACTMPDEAADVLSLVAQTAGWIAHALEEQRAPTPYRPRLAYTGPPPRGTTPRRTVDVVRDYLSRQ